MVASRNQAAVKNRARRRRRDLTEARLGRGSGGLNLVRIFPTGAAHDGELT
jgi:hypothetical protein